MTRADSGRQPRSEGLDPLDQARAASLADEGGVSGAALERQAAPRAGLPGPGALALFCAGAAGVLVVALACRQRGASATLSADDAV